MHEGSYKKILKFLLTLCCPLLVSWGNKALIQLKQTSCTLEVSQISPIV